jgi:hypothetical protein
MKWKWRKTKVMRLWRKMTKINGSSKTIIPLKSTLILQQNAVRWVKFGIRVQYRCALTDEGEPTMPKVQLREMTLFAGIVTGCGNPLD